MQTRNCHRHLSIGDKPLRPRLCLPGWDWRRAADPVGPPGQPGRVGAKDRASGREQRAPSSAPGFRQVYVCRAEEATMNPAASRAPLSRVAPTSPVPLGQGRRPRPPRASPASLDFPGRGAGRPGHSHTHCPAYQTPAPRRALLDRPPAKRVPQPRGLARPPTRRVPAGSRPPRDPRLCVRSKCGANLPRRAQRRAAPSQAHCGRPRQRPAARLLRGGPRWREGGSDGGFDSGTDSQPASASGSGRLSHPAAPRVRIKRRGGLGAGLDR